MYSLRLICSPAQVDLLSAELWELGTTGIHEVGTGEAVMLTAVFESNHTREQAVAQFAEYAPQWQAEENTNWFRYTQRAWPGRNVGEKLFLAPAWCEDPAPEGRERVIHNPGLACGTGEHACTQLALSALERSITPGCTVVDVGTGSGILAIAGVKLGASTAVAVDVDEPALQVARENFAWNQLKPLLIAGSADALANRCADITLANINGSVLLSILEDLLRITRPNGRLILTGFTDAELLRFQAYFPDATISTRDDWRCVVTRVF